MAITIDQTVVQDLMLYKHDEDGDLIEDDVLLEWGDITGAVSYSVMRSTLPDSGFVSIDEVTIPTAMDLDVIKKVISGRSVKEYARTEVMETDAEGQPRRRVIGAYIKCVACDLHSFEVVDITRACSHFDRLKLWDLVEKFSRDRMQDPPVRETIASVIATAQKGIGASARG